MATWTAEEVTAFLSLVADDRLWAAYVLLATTGMRRGEVLGLGWSDLDADGRRLSVAQTLMTINDEVSLGPTKMVRSRRDVALDSESVVALKAHRKLQARTTGGRRGVGRQRRPRVFARSTAGRCTPTGSRPRSSGTSVRRIWRSCEDRTASATPGRHWL